jgi:hypothetical protein
VKVFPQIKLQTLSLVAPKRRFKQRAVQVPASTIGERAIAGLWSVDSDGIRRPRMSGAEIKRRLSLLSVVDVMRVNRATIREGESHCIWPPDLLEKFRTADVITEKSAQHYVLREVNITRIK